MEKKKMTKRNVLQMSLVNNKNPMNISLGGCDKSVEISFNSKRDKNIPKPTSTITGRRIRQCCLYKYPKNEIMLSFPENVKFFAPNSELPFIIEAQCLENFKAAFYPLQLTDNVTKSMEEVLSLSMGDDYPEKMRDKKQYPSFEEYETSNKEEKKKNKLIMKHLHTLKRNFGQINETLKEIEKCQIDALSEEKPNNWHHNRISDKNKTKHLVKNGELIATQKSDKLLMPSKPEKYTKDKVLDYIMIKKQTKHDDKLERKENQMDSRHAFREDDFVSAGKAVTESSDNMKSLALILNNILKRNQIINDTSTEDSSQRKRKVDTLSEDSKVLDHRMTKKQEQKAQEKENIIGNHRKDDFVPAGKTMAELADNMKSTKLMLDDILRREKSMSEYKKKYIQDVEALYEDQQRLLEGSCHISDRSDRISSEECDLDKIPADQQQEWKKKNHKASEFRSNLRESGKEDESRYESNSKPILTDSKKKQKLEEKLENIIKEIQLLRFVNHIFEARKAKYDTKTKDRQTQEKSTETSEVYIPIDNSTSIDTDSSLREVTGVITHKYNILKGGQCAGNIYETTLTQTVKEFPSKTDEPKHAKLSKKEYLEALSDAKNAMKKLEATFDKLIPVLPKIRLQPGVDPDASITVSHHEENISGKIVKERTIEGGNGREKVAKDRLKRDVQEHTSRKDDDREKVAKDRIRHDIESHVSSKDEQFASKVQDGQEDRKSEQIKSAEPRLVVSPGQAVSEEHISSDQTDKKSNEVRTEETESKGLQKGFDGSKTKISSQRGAIQKRPIFRSEENLSSKGTMGFEILDETALKEGGELEKSQKFFEQPHKTEKLIISPSSVRKTNKRTHEKKYFIEDVDDTPKSFQIHHSSMKGSLKPKIIKHDHESAQRAQISSDPINFRQILDYLDLFFFRKSDGEKLIHLQEKSTLSKSHASDKSVSDSILSNLFNASAESEQLYKEHLKLKTGIITEEATPNKYKLESLKRNDRSRDSSKLRNAVIKEGTITSFSEYELEFPEAEDRLKVKGDRKLIRSDAFDEGIITSISSKVEDRRKLKEDKELSSDIVEEEITSISQYELKSPAAEDHQKFYEVRKVKSVSDILEGTITSISQYELESPTVEDRPKLKEDMNLRRQSDAIVEGTITSISQYELESPIAEDRKQIKEDKKVKSDSDILEGTIKSISQYELDSPITEDRRILKKDKNLKSDSDVIIEGTITSISQYELESPVAEDRRKFKKDKKVKSESDILEGTITSISQYELESSITEDRRTLKEDKNLRSDSDAIIEGTITSISQYELKSPIAEDRRKFKEDKKVKSDSDVIIEGTITSISQYELESPSEDGRKLAEDKKLRSNSDAIEEGTITSVSQYELESPKAVKSKKKSQNRYVPEYVEYSVSEPDTEVSSPIIDIAKVRDVQRGHTSLKEKSRSWYVPEYFEYSGSEPQTEVFGSIEEVSKLKDAQRDRTSKEKSRSWYVPEYFAYSGSEPETEVSSSIEEVSKLKDAQRDRTSKEKSRHWYVPEIVEYSVSEPETEVSGSIEEVSKLKDAQQDCTSEERSRSWYVPEHVEYSVSEPDTEEFNKAEEGYISDISQDKLNNSERGYTFLKDKSQNSYVPEKYMKSTLNEPSSKEFDNIKTKNMPDVSNYEIERVRASDLSNYYRRRSQPVHKDHDSLVSQHLRDLNIHEEFTSRENNTFKTPNVPLKYQSTTYIKSHREKIPKNVSEDFSLNKDVSRHFSLPRTLINENQKTKAKSSAIASPDVMSEARQQNVLDEMPRRGLQRANVTDELK